MSTKTVRPDEAGDAHTVALERLRHELAHPPFHSLFSPQVISVDPESGVVVILLPYQLSFRRAPDVDDIHGGVIAAVIDMAAHAAIAVQIGRMAPTIDLRIDYLRPVPGVDLIITARTLRVGRSIGRADVEVNTGPGTALLAVGRGSFSTFSAA
ncbi:MAG: PaaI family thioesterase [Polaromonas sp.]|jgi:uncharacterized protein (TIGR00369 family)|nr:PaaI family thioesterase [Polaromonas sp.]